MSTDVLKVEMENLGGITFDTNFDKDSNGLYFANINKDKSVRLMISRPGDLSEDPVGFVNQHPHVVIVDDTAQSFCLSPRPSLNISCDGATPDVALVLEQQRTYKIVLDGQVIASNAKPSQFEAILATYGLRVNYFVKPAAFICSDYEVSNNIYIPLVINDVNGQYHLKMTDEFGIVVLDNVLDFSQTTIGSGEYYPISGIVSVTKLSGNVYLLRINVVNIGTAEINNRRQIEFKPVNNGCDLIPPEQYSAMGYSPAVNHKLPVIYEGSAYWCINFKVLM